MDTDLRHIPDVIAEHLDEIVALCKEFFVTELELFGSATTLEFDPEKSDFDFFVEFDRSAPVVGLRQYFGFKESLERLLGRPVDLGSYRAIRNPYFKNAVDKQRINLYAA
jgi:predicted nucleotidyltransferase